MVEFLCLLGGKQVLRGQQVLIILLGFFVFYAYEFFRVRRPLSPRYRSLSGEAERRGLPAATVARGCQVSTLHLAIQVLIQQQRGLLVLFPPQDHGLPRLEVRPIGGLYFEAVESL